MDYYLAIIIFLPITNHYYLAVNNSRHVIEMALSDWMISITSRELLTDNSCWRSLMIVAARCQ